MSSLPPPVTPFLEPAAKELAEATDPHPRIYEVPPEQGRDILLGLQSDTSVPRPDVDEDWVEVDAGEWGKVRTRIIKPKGATGPLPVVFYIHGAGWVFGDEKTHDRLFRELAVGADAAGVFPVYNRAPEAKYPTQVEQNYAVGQWLLENGADHGLDTSRVAVTGESVGGCMSAVFALMNKERGGLGLKTQVLLYPVTDADFDTPSYQQFAEGYYLTRDGMIWFWDQYSEPSQRSEPHASPLRASLDQLKGLPPALVITDEADVLRDEGEMYANKLREAGVDVASVRVAGMVHDFLLLDSLRDTRAANVARHLAVDALKKALHDADAGCPRRGAVRQDRQGPALPTQGGPVDAEGDKRSGQLSGSGFAPGFRGRTHAFEGRLPPGQYPTESFPVLSAGPTPHLSTDDWTFTVTDETGGSRSWTWDEMMTLPQQEPTVDIHCVTRWSKFDTRWRGVSLDTLLDGVDTAADYLVAESYDGLARSLLRTAFIDEFGRQLAISEPADVHQF